MAYEKQNFLDGQIVTADHLNHIENGIVAAQNPRNLLDNSDFVHPVNSQGKSSYTANGYTIDRWMIYSGSGNQSMSLQDGILYFKGYFYQYVPVSDDVICTFAAKFSDGNVLCISGTAAQAKSTNLGNAQISYYHQSDMARPQVTIRTLDETQPLGLIWAALYEGVYTADTLPPYVPKGIKVEMLNCGVPMHPRNLLDNSDFRNPVNQRGQSSYSGEANKDVYTIDRWLFSWQADGRITLEDGYITKEAAGSGANTILTQRIDEKLIDVQKTYTAALMMADGTLYVYSGKPANGFGDWDNSIWVGYVYEKPVFQIRNGLSGNMLWVALYEGSYTADTLPPYVPKGYAAELAECVRYFRKTVLHGVAETAKYIAPANTFEPPFRIVPTITADTIFGAPGIGGPSASNISFVVHNDFVQEIVDNNSGLTPGVLYRLHITASADL